MLKTILYLIAGLLLAALSFYVLIEYKSDSGFYSACTLIVFAGVSAWLSLESFINYCGENHDSK